MEWKGSGRVKLTEEGPEVDQGGHWADRLHLGPLVLAQQHEVAHCLECHADGRERLHLPTKEQPASDCVSGEQDEKCEGEVHQLLARAENRAREHVELRVRIKVLEGAHREGEGHHRPRARESALPLTKTHELRRPLDLHFLEELLVNLVTPGEAQPEVLV